MKPIRNLFSHILTLALLLVVGVGIVWFFSSRPPDSQPVAQQVEATPTPTTSSNEDVIIVPTDTPAPTRIIEVTPVIITVPPSPTPAPSPTPTPTFEPLSDKPIGGYIFSPPELILTHNRMKIVGWRPDSNEELIMSNFENDQWLIEFLNVKSGQRERVVAFPNTIVGKPVWLPTPGFMSYLAYDEANEMQLYFSTPGGQPVKIPRPDGVNPPLAPAPGRQRVLVFDQQMGHLDQVQPGQGNPPAHVTLPEPLPVIIGGPFARYQAAWSDQTDWIAYHNPEKFILVNVQTGEVQDVDLDAGIDKPGRFWATYAAWSPDGQKLALIVTSDAHGQNLSFTQLAIFEPSTSEVQLLEDTFSYITNMAWAPDSKHILISPVIRTTEDGRNVNALFLVDIQTQQIIPVPIMPDEASSIMNSFESLVWSPDGQFIMVGYTEDPTEGRWYRVAVEVADAQ